jgi:hypothetical protein
MNAKAAVVYLHCAEAFIALRAARSKELSGRILPYSTAIPVLLKLEEITKNFWSSILIPNTLLALRRSWKACP